MADEKSSFYSGNDMNMAYLEVGIALKEINRMNPGAIPFSIPVLTPTMNTTKETTTKVVQTSKTNIVSENASAVEVSNIEVSNGTLITIPRELCAIPCPTYNYKGTINLSAKGTIGISGMAISNAHMSGSGSVVEGGSINVTGSITGSLSGSETETEVGTISGVISTTLNVDPVIPAGSKWLIAFIGGDTSMPRVVCRLPD